VDDFSLGLLAHGQRGHLFLLLGRLLDALAPQLRPKLRFFPRLRLAVGL